MVVRHLVIIGIFIFHIVYPNTDSITSNKSNRKKLIVASAATAAGIGVFAAYGYYHWWGGVRADFTWAKEGNMEQTSYTGGADKIGHMYGAYAIARGFTRLYEWTGCTKRTSLVIASGITQFLFTATELEDAFFDIGFSKEDIAFNVAGNLLALLTECYPALDSLMDFRTLYFPTHRQREMFPDNLNFAEDYSGQRLIYAFKFAGIPFLNRKWIKYLEIHTGYYTLGYKPPIYVGGIKITGLQARRIFLGFSLNIPLILDKVIINADKYPKTTKIIQGMYEYYQIPGTAPMVLDYRLPRE
jgi:hypothetical protein